MRAARRSRCRSTRRARLGCGADSDATIIDNDAAHIAWSITGGGNVAEGGAPSFSVTYTGATLADGNTVSITLACGAGTTEAADFTDSFLQDIDDAIAAVPGSGITRSGSVLTFSNPAVTSLTFTLPTFNDTLFEGAEGILGVDQHADQGSVVAPTANATIIDNDPLAGAPITLDVDEAAMSTAGATGSKSILDDGSGQLAHAHLSRRLGSIWCRLHSQTIFPD